jgi:metallo-beta-lactamase family protein
LYGVKDAQESLSLFKPVAYGQTFEPTPGISAHFRDAGHILGSGIAIIDIYENGQDDSKAMKRIVASGDLGMFDRPLMQDPSFVESADVLLIESTYGDRLHRTLEETEKELVEVITHTFKHGGNIVIPAFAVGRTQEILYLLLKLVKEKRLPHLNVWVDSPMATAATHLTEKFFDELDQESKEVFSWFKSHKNAMNLRFVADVEESKSLNMIKGGAIIISASGMCEAGRVVHHLEWNLPQSQNAIVITGFQAAGTLGRRLVDKASNVRIMGRDVSVKASVHTIGGLSAHADQAALIRWLKGFKQPPRKTFIVHGEPHASENLSEVIHEELGWEHVVIPQQGDLFPI